MDPDASSPEAGSALGLMVRGDTACPVIERVQPRTPAMLAGHTCNFQEGRTGDTLPRSKETRTVFLMIQLIKGAGATFPGHARSSPCNDMF